MTEQGKIPPYHYRYTCDNNYNVADDPSFHHYCRTYGFWEGGTKRDIAGYLSYVRHYSCQRNYNDTEKEEFIKEISVLEAKLMQLEKEDYFTEFDKELQEKQKELER